MTLRSYNWVDVLRLVAAAAVLFAHYHHFYLLSHLRENPVPEATEMPWGGLLWPLYDYGHFAVQLFWTMSGFVFAHVYTNRPSTTRQFTVARFARLYPLHFLTLIYVTAVQMLSWSALGHGQIYTNTDAYNFVLQLFMASNWPHIGRGLSFNGPIWSVSIEVLVYVLFWVTLPLILRWGVWAATAIAALSWGILLQGISLPFSLQYIAFCAAYFYAGTVVYLVLAHRPKLATPIAVSCSVLGVALAMAGLASVNGTAGLLAVALIAFAVLADDWMPRLGARLRPLGDISYSLYLVHVPLQMTFLVVADLCWPSARKLVDAPLFLLVYIGVSLWLAWVAYHAFEKPVGKALRRRLSAKPN